MHTAALILEFITPQGAYDRVRTLVEVFDRSDIHREMNELALREIPSGAIIQGRTVEWLAPENYT